MGGLHPKRHRIPLFVLVKEQLMQFDVSQFKAVFGEFVFLALTYGTVGYVTNPREVEHVVVSTQKHTQPFDAISDLYGHRSRINATHLLEIGELSNFHPVQKHLPAHPQAPSVGASQLSSSKRISCSSGRMPNDFRLSR